MNKSLLRRIKIDFVNGAVRLKSKTNNSAKQNAGIAIIPVNRQESPNPQKMLATPFRTLQKDVFQSKRK